MGSRECKPHYKAQLLLPCSWSTQRLVERSDTLVSENLGFTYTNQCIKLNEYMFSLDNYISFRIRA